VNALLRDRQRAGSGRVGMVELFFDLVFVFAVTQLSHTLLAELSLENLVRVGVLFLAVWWVWMYTAHCRRLVPVRVHSALVRGAGHRVRGRVLSDAGRPHAVRSLGGAA
jgi:hypothetical protein